MIRLSASQAALFFDPPRTASGKPRTRKPAGWLPENIVESQVLGFLRVRSWRCIRQHSGVFLGAGVLIGILEKSKSVAQVRERINDCMTRFGEKGRCDWMCVRTSSGRVPAFPHDVFELEVKGPGNKPSPHQLAYIRKLNATGTPALWVDSLEMLTKWYRENFG